MNKIKLRHKFLLLTCLFSSTLIIFYQESIIPLVSKSFEASHKNLIIKRSHVMTNHLCNRTVYPFDNIKAMNSLKSNLALHLKSFRTCENHTDIPLVAEKCIFDKSSKTIFKICLKNLPSKSNGSNCSARYFTKKMNLKESNGNLDISKYANHFELDDGDLCTHLNQSKFVTFIDLKNLNK